MLGRRLLSLLGGLASVGLLAGCGVKSAMSTAGSGGMDGPGGVLGTGGGMVEAAPGSGGTPGTGGMLGTGGSAGMSGGLGQICGTKEGIDCWSAFFCDLDSSCGTVANATGVCVMFGPDVSCSTAPLKQVCGCNGRTYNSECSRQAAGVLKRSDGACPTGGGSGTGGGGSGGSPGTGGRTGPSGSGGSPEAGGGIDAILKAIPGDNQVSGWVVDPDVSITANGPAIATTMQGAVDLVDGAADSWYSATFAPNVFAWQNYKNTSVNPPDGYLLKIFVLEMPSVAQAMVLYDAMVDGAHSLYTATNLWEDTSPMIGDRGRITNSSTDWWINFRKGIYYCEVRLTYAEETDLVGKQQIVAFATAVAAKM